MTGLIRNGLLGITCVVMALALSEALIRESGVKKVLRFAGGLILTLTIIGPVKEWDGAVLSNWMEGFRHTMQEYQGDLESKQEILYGGIIAEDTEAYILDKAEEFGVVCQVEVTVSCGEDGMCYPEQVTVTGDWTDQQKTRLQNMLESDLGIPISKQYYKENGP